MYRGDRAAAAGGTDLTSYSWGEQIGQVGEWMLDGAGCSSAFSEQG